MRPSAVLTLFPGMWRGRVRRLIQPYNQKNTIYKNIWFHVKCNLPQLRRRWWHIPVIFIIFISWPHVTDDRAIRWRRGRFFHWCIGWWLDRIWRRHGCCRRRRRLHRCGRIQFPGAWVGRIRIMLHIGWVHVPLGRSLWGNHVCWRYVVTVVICSVVWKEKKRWCSLIMIIIKETWTIDTCSLMLRIAKHNFDFVEIPCICRHLIIPQTRENFTGVPNR